jgi:hypothetical protein
VAKKPDTIEEAIRILDFKMSQLKRDYDQYFLGSRPREPVLLRGEMNKLVIMLTNTAIQNTALRFRFSSLCSRFQAFRRQWDENLRKIEQGTYERHRFKAKIHGAKGAPAPKAGSSASAAGDDDLYQSYIDARLACGQPVDGISRQKLEGVIEKQRTQLRDRYGDAASFRFRVAVEDGKVKVKASRASN